MLDMQSFKIRDKVFLFVKELLGIVMCSINSLLQCVPVCLYRLKLVHYLCDVVFVQVCFTATEAVEPLFRVERAGGLLTNVEDSLFLICAFAAAADRSVLGELVIEG